MEIWTSWWCYRRSQRITKVIIWESWMCEPNVLTVHPLVIQIWHWVNTAHCSFKKGCIPETITCRTICWLTDSLTGMTRMGVCLLLLLLAFAKLFSQGKSCSKFLNAKERSFIASIASCTFIYRRFTGQFFTKGKETVLSHESFWQQHLKQHNIQLFTKTDHQHVT